MHQPLLLAATQHSFRLTGIPALLIILAILALIVIGIVAVVKFLGRHV
jgi:hypothetical protein